MKSSLTSLVIRQRRTLILRVMDPGIGLRQLPRLISRLESLCHSKCHCLRHFSLGAEKRVTLHRLVQIRRDERKNMIVRRIRRAVRDPETNG